MATTKTPKTKKPTGLKLIRDGNKFTAKWKIGDKDYGDGQGFQWRTNDGSWHTISVGKKATSAHFTIDASNWFPASSKELNRVQFRVRGNRDTYDNGKSGKDKITYKPTVSDWATKAMTIRTPNAAKVTNVSRPSSDTVRFTWKAKTSDKDRKWFRSVEWQALLKANCNTSKGKNLKWKAGQPGWQTNTSPDPTNNKDFVESAAIIETGSHTRWFRIRSRGPHGASKWEYKSFVWADPNAATVDKAWTTRSNNGYTVSVRWTLSTSLSRPVDKVKVQYVITNPDEGMECPAGAGWSDAPNTNLKASQKKAVFPVDALCGEDEALYVRVVTTHAGNDVASLPMRAAKGYVAEPGDTGEPSVSLNPDTYKATITCTNNSVIPDSFLAVYYKDASTEEFCVGIIENGQNSVTVQCPIWEDQSSVGFRVQAVAGSYEEDEERDIEVGSLDTYYTVYKVDAIMTSDDKTTGDIPVTAKDIKLTATSTPGTVNVSWEWSWGEATMAEISWSDHDDAWQSTDEPSKYEVKNIHAANWNVSGLETGKTWYFRVRLVKGSGDDATYAAYSNIAEISLASAPSKPSLALSEGIITETGSTVASWVYTTTDGTPQGAAWIAEVIYPDPEGATGATGAIGVTGAIGATGGGDEPTYSIIAETDSAQQYTLSAEDLGWEAGETHLIAVKVQSASGQISDEWSTPVPVEIAVPLTCSITDTTLLYDEETISGDTRVFSTMIDLPLIVVVEGAGEGGTTTLAIERTKDYPIERPDEEDYVGFEGETIYLKEQVGEEPFVIEPEDLIGSFDDGAEYQIVATVYDGLGQTAEAETMKVFDEAQGDYVDTEDCVFEVHWEHQAEIPGAQVSIESGTNAAILKAIAPPDTVDWQLCQGDTCDIYRLSADKPELIYAGASFYDSNNAKATTYVDPYPALGEQGGHRFVFRSYNGDYITLDDTIAWKDTGADDGDIVRTDYNIIDFPGGSVMLRLDVDLSNSWEKDFKETQYLGGAVQGDWNPAVSRSGSIKATAIVQNDADTLATLRRLAVYPGICQVRTKDGSSFKANVEVSADYQQDSAHKTCEVGLDITRVDPEGQDGLTLAEWEDVNQEG